MRNRKFVSKSILGQRSGVNQSSTEKLINVDLHSEDKLGRLLSDRHLFVFSTWCGEVNSMKTYMDFIATPDYPVELLTKKKFTFEDLKKVSHIKKINLDNFWALVTVAMIDKVKACKELRTLLEQNEYDFTCIIESKTTELFGKSVSIKNVNNKMARYLAVCRLVQELVKTGDIDDPERVKYWVEQCKDYPEKELTDGVPFVVNEG